jgi:cysteine sulfinate desulfinase/cysteine desulfurase-like protein
MGYTAEVYRSSVRFSVGWTTTEGEVDEAIERIAGVIGKLRRA